MTMSSAAAGHVTGTMVALARTPSVAARYDLTPRAAVLCSVLALAAITALDLMDGRLGLVFNVGFVLVVLSAATAVHVRGLFTVGVLPPFLMVGFLLATCALRPEAIVIAGLPENTGVLGMTLAATIDHGVALLVGHGLALVAILARIAGSSAPR